MCPKIEQMLCAQQFHLESEFAHVCRSGLIPLDNTSDIAGPLTRSVEDAARMFGVLAGFDARDPLTQFALNASLPANYTQFLDAGGLKARSCWARASCAAPAFGKDIEVWQRLW